MLRKLSLGVACCTAALTLSIGPSTALGHADDPGCNGNDWDPHGVYSSEGGHGAFDLTMSPATSGANSELRGGAVLCGTDPGDGWDAANPTDTSFQEDGVFATRAVITYPNTGEKVTCARPSLAASDPDYSAYVEQCDLDGNGAVDGDENVANGTLVGTAQSDSWCDSATCYALGDTFTQMDDVSSDTIVRFNADGNAHCAAGDEAIAACFQAETTIALGPASVDCDSDVVIHRDDPAVDPYTLTLYQPECSIGGAVEVGPVYFDGVDGLLMCKYAGCGASGTPLLKNGKYAIPTHGAYRFTLDVTMSDGTTYTATKDGQWALVRALWNHIPRVSLFGSKSS